MDGFGPITNTRSLEHSVEEALEQLEGLRESRQLLALRERGVRYRDILASWEMMPPQPKEHAETVSHVLQLLGEIMAYVNGTEPFSLPPSSSEPPDGLTPVPPRSMPPASTPSPFASKRPPSGRQKRMPRRGARTNKRQASVGRIELEQVFGGGRQSCADVLYPFRRPWSKLAAVPGAAARRLHDDVVTGEKHMFVRLVEGAELPEHRQDNTELIYILSGGLRVGDESVFAGAVIRSHAGAVCPPLVSLGETELLIVGSYREELGVNAAAASVP